MKILVTGSHGLVGSQLVPSLTNSGHKVVRLIRSQVKAPNEEINWNPRTGSIEQNKLENLDGIVHLAGENIATGRWTEGKKNLIRDSRVKGTGLLAVALSSLKRKPKVFISASAIGFYGNSGNNLMNEQSPSGSGFLAETCRAWESASKSVDNAGARVAHLRFGVILSAKGGALSKMLPPFKFGLGGKIGTGRQYMSWVAINDVVRAILHVLENKELHGPINVVAPEPVTNLEFTKILGKVLSKPTLFPMPAFAARLFFGEMADELLLASTRVEPRQLNNSGFAFQHSHLEETLRFLLKK